MSNASGILSERRRAPRQRVLKSAKIAFANFLYVLDCTVRDISSTGAKLRLLSSEPVPDHFFIFFIETKTMCQAHVVWRKGKDLGIQFEETPKSISESSDPRLKRFEFMI